MRKRSVEVNGETVKVFDAIVNVIKAEFGKDEPFVWMGNRDLPYKEFAARFPTLPHRAKSFKHRVTAYLERTQSRREAHGQDRRTAEFSLRPRWFGL